MFTDFEVAAGGVQATNPARRHNVQPGSLLCKVELLPNRLFGNSENEIWNPSWLEFLRRV
jgi:hypothetical protein